MATLLLELSLTRIFSVVVYYHMAFLPISIAMFGLGAGGCMLLIPLLNQFGGPSTVVGAAITFAVAAAIWHSMAGSVAGRAGSVALALILTAFLTYNQRHPILDITHAKGHTLENELWS